MFNFFNDIGFMSASETPKPDSDQPSQPPSPVGDGSMGASGAAANRGVASGMPPDGLASDPGSGPATASASAKGTESASASAHTPNPGTAPAPDSTAATKPETSPAPDPEPAPDVPGPRAAKKLRCHHRGQRSERPGRRGPTRPGRAHRSRFGSRGYHRRRNPHQRAHPAGVSARCLLGRAPLGDFIALFFVGSPSTSTDFSGCIPTCP